VTRPKFSLVAASADFLLPGAAVLVVAARLGSARLVWLAGLGYVLLRLPRVAQWAILSYQRFAPKHIRNGCVFVPTCSEFTRQAIARYGLVAGLARGAGRVRRCHHPNHGLDEP
jgi:putative component of membrane protein insertase Oxa1/YidC/SpoIIIJ protein YidD